MRGRAYYYLYILTLKGGDDSIMDEAKETRLKELRHKADKTPAEKDVLLALFELDESYEDLEDAEAVVVEPQPDPVSAAKAQIEVAKTAYEQAEAALAATPV